MKQKATKTWSLILAVVMASITSAVAPETINGVAVASMTGKAAQSFLRGEPFSSGALFLRQMLWSWALHEVFRMQVPKNGLVILCPMAAVCGCLGYTD